MTKWRYANPEVRLNHIIESLERDRETNHQAAIRELLLHGPLSVAGDVRQQLDAGLVPGDYGLIRAELLAFLRNLVRHGEVPFSRIGLRGIVNFAANRSKLGRVTLAIEGAPRDLAILQLTVFLHLVGLFRIALCGDPGCSRMFVKTHRRAFCSVRCQKRIQARRLRQKDRQARLQERAQRDRSFRSRSPRKGA